MTTATILAFAVELDLGDDTPDGHDSSCLHTGDRYATRFGDVCCEHDVPVAWSASLVRDGLYGDGTARWIAGHHAAMDSPTVLLCRRTLLATGVCECSN